MGNGTLPITDVELIDEMKKTGRLLPVSELHNAVMASCGDGHRFRDIFLHALALAGLIHPVVLNGGPLLIADDEFDQLHQGEVMISNIIESIRIKGFKNVVLISHWPCAIASKKGLSIDQVLKKTLRAAEILRERLGPGYNVLAKFHVDYGTFSRPNKYWFSRKNFLLGLVNGQIFRLTCERRRSYVINER